MLIVCTLCKEYMKMIKLFIILKEGISSRFLLQGNSCLINLFGCMPFLTCLCLVSTGTFDLHVYTNQGCVVPEKWDETKPCIIKNAQELSLRTFSTSLHKVETHVIYKAEWTGIMFHGTSSEIQCMFFYIMHTVKHDHCFNSIYEMNSTRAFMRKSSDPTVDGHCLCSLQCCQ